VPRNTTAIVPTFGPSGEQATGQAWRGLRPRTPGRAKTRLVGGELIDGRRVGARKVIVMTKDVHLVRDCPACFVAQKLRPSDPSVAIDPGGGLARLLANPRVGRSLRRLVLAVVQAKPGPRRTRMERRAEAGLRAAGIVPA